MCRFLRGSILFVGSLVGSLLYLKIIKEFLEWEFIFPLEHTETELYKINFVQTLYDNMTTFLDLTFIHFLEKGFFFCKIRQGNAFNLT